MTKKQAIDILGGTHQKVADALGITRSAVTQWPEELRQDQVDRVIGAAYRLRLLPTEDQEAAQSAA